MADSRRKRVLVLVNPRSGVNWSFAGLRREIDATWDVAGNDLKYQFIHDPSDGVMKAQRAVEDRVDVVLAAGGDGTVSSIGGALAGSRVALGVVPVGSGNGFARHFGIPMSVGAALRALVSGREMRMDVGMADSRLFLVTCSMAWDAAIVRSFNRMPVRGVLPYVFAGVNEFMAYEPQEIRIELDTGEKLSFPDPLVFTIANLAQFGGGALIAPHAKADDGCLELVVALRQDVPKLIANIGRLFDGTIHEIPEVIHRRFRRMTVRRRRGDPVQMDGELVDARAEIRVAVMPSALTVLVPAKPVP
jgi:YegS/Rv2252/BmrU family lipid kinase